MLRWQSWLREGGREGGGFFSPRGGKKKLLPSSSFFANGSVSLIAFAESECVHPGSVFDNGETVCDACVAAWIISLLLNELYEYLFSF